MPVFDTVLWDWNGTLLDDAALCCELLNTMLARHGYAPVGSMEAYRQVFCFPIETYYRRAGFDFSRHPFAALADEYMRLYTPRSLGCPLQPDACAVLDALRAQGMRQVMLSASKRENLQQQVEHFGLRSRFDTLLGLSDIYAKSKTEVGLRWLRESGADPATGSAGRNGRTCHRRAGAAFASAGTACGRITENAAVRVDPHPDGGVFCGARCGGVLY